jgi:hypothetical protein
MPVSYAKNKVHIYNWNAKNPERSRELSRARTKRYDTWKRIQKIYFNILLD